MRLQDVEGYTQITKQSIENVPCKTIYSGEGSQRKNKYIQYLARKVLQLSATRDDGYKNDEVGILADIENQNTKLVIHGYWDDYLKTSKIDIDSNDEYSDIVTSSNLQSLVFVHNHPNNSTVSLSDILMLMSETASHCVVAVGNNGEIHYSIKISLYGCEKLASRLCRMISNGEISETVLYRKIIENPNKFGLYIE